MIPELRDSTTCFCCGPVSSGKTHLLKLLAARMERVIVFDPTMEWESGFEVFPFWQAESGPKKLAARFEELDRTGAPYKIAVWPRNIETSFDWLTRILWQGSLSRWFIIEEIHTVMTPSSQEDMMNLLSRFSRKRQIGIIGSSQRIADVHKSFTSACRMSMFFHTTEPRDLDAIGDRYGESAASAVGALRPLDYDEVNGITRAIPEMLIHRRGVGIEIVEAG